MKFTTDSPVFGVVDSEHASHYGWTLEKAMEPFTATVVIVALVALAC